MIHSQDKDDDRTIQVAPPFPLPYLFLQYKREATGRATDFPPVSPSSSSLSSAPVPSERGGGWICRPDLCIASSFSTSLLGFRAGGRRPTPPSRVVVLCIFLLSSPRCDDQEIRSRVVLAWSLAWWRPRRGLLLLLLHRVATVSSPAPSS